MYHPWMIHLWIRGFSLLLLDSFITGMRICVVRVVGRSSGPKVVILVLRVEVQTLLLVSLLLLLSRRPRDIELERACKSSFMIGVRHVLKNFANNFVMSGKSSSLTDKLD